MWKQHQDETSSPHHEHVGLGVGERAEVGHGVLDERPEDEAEADAQVHVDGLDEAIGVWQRGARTHHQGGHGQHRGDSWSPWKQAKQIFGNKH